MARELIRDEKFTVTEEELASLPNNPLKVVVIVGKPWIVAAVIGLVHDLLPLGRNGRRRKPDRIMPSRRDQNTSAAMAGVSRLDVIRNSG